MSKAALEKLKVECAAAVEEARNLRKVQRDIIEGVGREVSALLFNRRILLTNDDKVYLPMTIKGQEVFCRGFDPHAVRQEISVKVSPYRADGSIGEKKFDVSVSAIEQIIK